MFDNLLTASGCHLSLNPGPAHLTERYGRGLMMRLSVYATGRGPGDSLPQRSAEVYLDSLILRELHERLGKAIEEDDAARREASPCPECKGSGWTLYAGRDGTHGCLTCDGSGIDPKTEV